MAAPIQDKTANTLIIENEALRRGFTIIPNYVLRNPRLSFGARLTYTLLLSYAWQEGSCFPGQEKLAADLQTNSRTVRRYLDALEAGGLIKVKQRGLGQTNVYILTDFKSSIDPEPDRTLVSGQDRTEVSSQDRTVVSANNNADEKNSDRRRLSTGNRLVGNENAGEAGSGGLSSLATLIRNRSLPARKKRIVDRKEEVAPLAEEAVRRLGAPQSLGMFYKVLLQLYPEHHHLFDEAVEEAAAEPKPRVSRSALFAHIVRRLAREYSVPLKLGTRLSRGIGEGNGPP